MSMYEAIPKGDDYICCDCHRGNLLLCKDDEDSVVCDDCGLVQGIPCSTDLRTTKFFYKNIETTTTYAKVNSQNNEGVDTQPQTTLCSNGCGFFANAGTSGKCSKCYRETEQTQQKLEAVAQKATAAVSRPPQSTPQTIVSTCTQEDQESSAVAPAVQVASSEPCTAALRSPPPSNPCRCQVGECRKKLGLTGFKCRCGLSFCGTHRYAESHNCTFDYKTFERLKIADNNPLVQASKIQKI